MKNSPSLSLRAAQCCAAVLLFSVASSPSLRAGGAPKIAVFPTINDNRAKEKVDEYEAWVGRPMDYIIQGAPGDTWAHITNINWWIGQWAGHPVSYRDRLVLALCILPEKDSSATLAIGATGAYNPYWRDVAEKLVAAGHGSITLRLGWEMNGNWYRWSAIGRGADFRNYWIQIVNTMRAVPGAAFKYCWNPTAGNVGMNPMDAFPGAAYVDLIGIDLYDISGYYNTPGYPDNLPAWDVNNRRDWAWRTMKQLESYNLDWWSAQARQLGIPLCFPEWGLDTLPANTGGRDNPHFVREFYKWINDPLNNVEWAAYFEWNGGPTGRNHAICFDDQYPQAKTLFPQLFSHAGKTLFGDSFDDGAADGWTGGTDYWSVVQDGGNPVYQCAFNWFSSDTSSFKGFTWANSELEVDVKITQMETWSYTFLYGRYVDASNHYLLALQKTDSATRLVLSRRVGGVSTTLGTVNIPLPLNTWKRIILRMDGSHLTASVDGTTLIDVQDGSLSAGAVGFGTQKQAARFDRVSVRHAGPFLTENFDDNRAQGWTPTSEQWTFTPRGTGKAWTFAFEWARRNGLATAGSYSWTDYAISTDFRVATPFWGWSETQVFARYTDANNYYLLKVQDAGGTRRLVMQKKVAGTLTTLGTANVAVNADTWYTVSFAVNGTSLTGALNGVQLLQATDASHPAGKAALGSWTQNVAFDNVVID